jgi:hypothetical protein
MSERVCATCEWYAQQKGDFSLWGYCRANPPVLVPVEFVVERCNPDQPDFEDYVEGAWPLVTEDAWCGCHQPKESGDA